METLFVFDKRNYQDCQNAFRGPRNREYYAGEYSIEPGGVIDVRAERKAIGSSSIIRLRSRTRLFFRRSWSHIREDATDVAVLCFVKRGQLRISHQCGGTVAKAGDFVVTRSMTPFSVESLPSEDGIHELMHLTVPMQMLRRAQCPEVKTGFCVAASGRKFAMAERILADLFEDGGELSEQVGQLLVDSVLSVLSEAIRGHQPSTPQRQTLAEKRLSDVLRYIDTHLSDSNLSVASVAKGCGISPRYLSRLLKVHGTPFSTLVWEKRLKTAGEWLAASQPGEASISEIAYRVGFKNPAHFSRMFKRQYKLSPRQYRSAAVPAAREAQALNAVGEACH